MLLSVISNKANACVGWSFLMASATCLVLCLYLDANGLYINIPKFDFSLPIPFYLLCNSNRLGGFSIILTILTVSSAVCIPMRLLTKTKVQSASFENNGSPSF